MGVTRLSHGPTKLQRNSIVSSSKVKTVVVNHAVVSHTYLQGGFSFDLFFNSFVFENEKETETVNITLQKILLTETSCM